jgi:hypothetical protein
MTESPENPLADYIVQQIDRFAEEAERLGDSRPLVDYKALVDTLFLIQTKLGTLEHEVALAKLSSEIKLANAESADAWRQMWRTFKNQRKKASQTKRWFEEHNQEAEATLAALEKSFSEMTSENEDLRQSMRAAIDAIHGAHRVARQFESGWGQQPWLFLQVELHIYLLNVRYLIANLLFFLFKHGFILGISICLAGVTYSKVANLLVAQVVMIAPHWPWFAGALGFGVYMFKKYYVDPRVKKLQTRLETKRLRPLPSKRDTRSVRFRWRQARTQEWARRWRP